MIQNYNLELWPEPSLASFPRLESLELKDVLCRKDVAMRGTVDRIDNILFLPSLRRFHIDGQNAIQKYNDFGWSFDWDQAQGKNVNSYRRRAPTMI